MAYSRSITSSISTSNASRSPCRACSTRSSLTRTSVAEGGVTPYGGPSDPTVQISPSEGSRLVGPRSRPPRTPTDRTTARRPRRRRTGARRARAGVPFWRSRNGSALRWNEDEQPAGAVSSGPPTALGGPGQPPIVPLIVAVSVQASPSSRSAAIVVVAPRGTRARGSRPWISSQRGGQPGRQDADGSAIRPAIRLQSIPGRLVPIQDPETADVAGPRDPDLHRRRDGVDQVASDGATYADRSRRHRLPRRRRHRSLRGVELDRSETTGTRRRSSGAPSASRGCLGTRWPVRPASGRAGRSSSAGRPGDGATGARGRPAGGAAPRQRGARPARSRRRGSRAPAGRARPRQEGAGRSPRRCPSCGRVHRRREEDLGRRERRRVPQAIRTVRAPGPAAPRRPKRRARGGTDPGRDGRRPVRGRFRRPASRPLPPRSRRPPSRRSPAASASWARDEASPSPASTVSGLTKATSRCASAQVADDEHGPKRGRKQVGIDDGTLVATRRPRSASIARA